MVSKTSTTQCRNCNTMLQGDYCHVCGQSADEPRRAVIGLVQDVFVDTLAIDGKLVRTLWLLLTRPGRLARRYLDGKRVRYSPPFRLYLFASVFFFFVAFWFSDLNGLKNAFEIEPAAQDAAVKAREDALDEVAADQSIPPDAREAVAAVRDGPAPAESVATEAPGTPAKSKDGEKDKPFSEKEWKDVSYEGPDWLEPYTKQIFEAAQRATDDPRLFFAQIKENLPRTMLLAPVLYAFLLLLLYAYRRKYLVYDHLVVSLYMHAALYAHLLILILLLHLPKFSWISIFPIAWAMLQPFAVFRQAYGSNWFSVIAKGLISILFYAIVFALLISLGVSFALYQA